MLTLIRATCMSVFDSRHLATSAIVFWSVVAVLVTNSAAGAILPSGNVLPAYPGVNPDPWNVSTELVVGDFATGALQIGGGSDMVSNGGTAGFDPSIIGAITLTGAGSTWTNNQDLLLGVFGIGKLDVFAGAQVDNQDASVGHIDGGIGQVTVSGTGSRWTSATELVIGTSGSGSLTIENQGLVRSADATVALNNDSTGLVVIDGEQSAWEVSNSLSVGNAINGGTGGVTLTGAGSRLYLGAAAVTQGATLPVDHTAIVVSKSGSAAQLSIYEGNSIQNSGSAYIGGGHGESGAVEINGEATSWQNDGAVFLGMNGSGTLALVHGATVSSGGPITVGAAGLVSGIGNLIGNVSNAGIVQPGQAIGTLNVDGDYSQAVSGQLRLELSGTSAGAFDTLAVTQAASLDGKLKVELIAPFLPQLDDSFTVLTAAGGITGAFASADLPTLGAGKMWRVTYSANAATLAVKLAGDYNDNGIVDAADFTVWRSLLGNTLDPRADGDTNGVIDINDYLVWKANFGMSAGVGSLLLAGQSVPEPSSSVLAAMGTLAVFLRRRRG